MASRASNGFVELRAAGAVSVRLMEMPFTPEFVGGVGVFPLDLSRSPRRIKASTARSTFPFTPFSTV